ncbi:Cell division protein FtsK [Streptococcus sp. DD10]|uniref:hypothetical protein n=1 Tax=Streptococcus sp. DD10 TaxID=1777878 RepID=UPI000797DAAC|nr:Cell division protein FtsK [Streptococcus sp. DD10]
MKIMTNKKNSKTNRKTRRPTKAEQERQAAIKRMLISLSLAVLLIFTCLRMGAVGVTLYNFVRVFVGSLAYPVMGSIFIYLFSLRRLKNILGGYLVQLVYWLVCC